MNEETLFHLILEKPVSERAVFLDEACGGDAALRRRIEVLLQAHEHPASFLQSPVSETKSEGTLDPPARVTSAGTMIGRYKLLEPIGEGGYGTVFMAEQTTPVQRKVALKIIKAGMDTKQVIARFEAERQALALMDHPNIAKVFDAGVSEAGRPYFVMELVKGMPITRYCDEHRIEPRQRLELFMQVCQAVQHAHQKGIIHRDLKPNNVLVAQYDGKPVPKVIDFGVAKATGQQLTERTMFTGIGDVIGTLEYMSPEQAEVNQLDVDTRSDIYTLGVLLYELLTGSTPLEHKRVMKAGLLEMLRVVREEEPQRPSARLSTSEQLPSISANRGLEPRKLSGLVKGELDWIVMKALEKDRSRRYETANGLAVDVQRYLNDEAVQACPPSRVYRLRKFARRNKVALATAAMFAIVLVAATISSTWQKRQAVAARAAAESSERRALASEAEARRQAEEAVRQNTIAQRRLAEGLITQAQTFIHDGRYFDAKARLAQATESYQSIGDEPLPADLLTLDVLAFAPLPLNRFDTRPAYRPEGHILPDGRTAILRRVMGHHRPGLAELVDLRTGQVLRKFTHAHAIVSTAVSSDGRFLLTGGSAEPGAATTMPADQVMEPFALTLWDVEQGRVIRRFVGHKDIIRYAAFSRDGRRAVSSSIDKTIRVWDVSTGSVIHECTMNVPVNTVAISPDGRLIASNYIDSDGGIWEADTGKLRYPFSRTRVGTSPLPLHFSAGGQLLLAGSKDTWVWEFEHGRFRVIGPPALSLTFLSDDRRVLSAEGPQILMRDAQTGQPYAAFTESNQTFQLSTSTDGKYMVAGSSPGSISHWLLRSSVDIISVGRGGRSALDIFAVTPDGRAAICPADDGIIKVWDLATGLLLRDLTGGNSAEANTVAVSPDGNRVLAGGRNGQLRLWEVATARLIRSWQAHEGVASGQSIAAIAFSPDGRSAVSGADDGLAKVWDLENGGELATFRGHFKPNPVSAQTVCGIAFTPDGTQVVSSCLYDNDIRVWDAASGEERRVLFSQVPFARVLCLRFLKGDRLLSAAGDGVVRLTDLATGRELRRLEGTRASATIDGRLVASIADDTLRVWEGATGTELLRSPYDGGGGTWVDFSPDGRYLVCINGGSMNIRDLTRPARYREFERLLPEARTTLQTNPNDSASLKVIGEWYAFRGVWEWGVEFLEKARANGADISNLSLARCYWKSGDNEAARRAFGAAVARHEAPREYLELCLAALVDPSPPAVSPASTEELLKIADEKPTTKPQSR